MGGLNSIIADPEFLKLSPDAQRIVVGKQDLDFAGLSPDAQGIALRQLMSGVKTTAPNPTALANQALKGSGITVSPIKVPAPPPAAGMISRVLTAAGAKLADSAHPLASPFGQGDQLAYPPELQQQVDALPLRQSLSFHDPSYLKEQQLVRAYYAAHPTAENPYAGADTSKVASENSPLAIERIGTGDVAGGIGESLANVAQIVQGGRSSESPTAINVPTPRAAMRSSVAPRIVRIEGVDMPVLAGEAPDVPTTGPEKLQVGLKRSGAASDEFTRVEVQQQNAVKQVIRNVVQKNSGLIGPLPESPTAAVMQGAESNFEQARPIYQALDASLTHIPTVVDELGTLTQKAVGRLRNKGIEIGNTYNPGQPLQSAMAIRSELLDMQRAARNSGDTLKAKVAGDEASALDGDIHETLGKKPPLLASWRQANALWKRGIALRDVADAIDSTVKGTPVEAQINIPGQIGARPVEINASAMVEKFNDLARDGVLDKAFGEGYSRSIRQTVEFLKRAQETNIGNRTARLSGYSPRSAVGHSVVDFIYRLGGGQIAKLMTDTTGAKMVANLTGATTPEQVAARTVAIKNRLNAGQYASPHSNYQQTALPSGQAALSPASSIQPPAPINRTRLNAGTPPDVLEGEYVGTPQASGPARRIATPAPPPETFRMPPPARPQLPLPRQKSLPPATSRQMPNISDSTAKLYSKTRGYTDVADVMEAGKNGILTPAEVARIAKLLKGRAAEITRPLAPPQ